MKTYRGSEGAALLFLNFGTKRKLALLGFMELLTSNKNCCALRGIINIKDPNYLPVFLLSDSII
jgi:hypothetical protein